MALCWLFNSLYSHNKEVFFTKSFLRHEGRVYFFCDCEALLHE